MNLMQKYTPKTLDTVILDDKILDPIIRFANGWMQGYPDTTHPALLLHGKSGIGKTLTARVLCKDCDFSMIEINASSVRTNKQLLSLLKIPKVDFFGRKILVFLDEADSIKGGEVAIKKVIMEMKFPVIMTANNQYKVPKILRDISEEIKFWSPKVANLKQQLLKINKSEGLGLSMEIIDKAAESQDYRTAYQILESKQLLNIKEKKMSLLDCTRNIFYKEAEAKFDDTKSMLYYFDENGSKVYDILDLQEMFEIAIKADKYNRRGQVSFANCLIKDIPKASIEIDEIKKPVFFEKDKKKFGAI